MFRLYNNDKKLPQKSTLWKLPQKSTLWALITSCLLPDVFLIQVCSVLGCQIGILHFLTHHVLP